jgi:hypothetical protein
MDKIVFNQLIDAGYLPFEAEKLATASPHGHMLTRLCDARRAWMIRGTFDDRVERANMIRDYYKMTNELN